MASSTTTEEQGQQQQSAAKGDNKNDDDDDVVCWLRIIQINDCYELDNMASLKTLVDQHRGQAHTDLVILSGDFVAPSLLSSLNFGASMVDCLNAIGFTHVCLGNHETDISMKALDQRLGQSQFTWINSNMPQLDEDVLVKNGHKMKRTETVTVTNPTTGACKTVGMLGVLTPDPGLYRPGAFGGCDIQPVMETTRRLLPQLQQETDFVLPLTHQSMDEDRKFCKEFGGQTFPLVIGGHDHTVMQETVNGCRISKVGQDAEHVGVMDLKWLSSDGSKPTITVHPLLNTADFEPDPSMAERVASHQKLVLELERAKLFNIQDWIPDSSDDGGGDVDQNFSTVGNRLGPSTGSTAFCSMLRMGLHAQVGIINAGNIRGSRHYHPDDTFTLKELKAEIPYPTVVSAYHVPGHVLEDTIWWSRRFARQDPPVAHGCYIHTCDAVSLDEDADDDGKITILSIHNKPFDRNKEYLTVLPIQFLMGIDHHEPLLKWAKEHNIQFDCDESGVPAKNLIVEVFSTLVWLQMGSFGDMDVDNSGRITREEVQRRLQDIYGPNVADVVVDNVMSMADEDSDDGISPLEMTIAHFAARDMMQTSGKRASMRQTLMIQSAVHSVLGQDLSAEQSNGIAAELRDAFEQTEGGRIDKSGIRNVMGGLRRKTLLMPKIEE